MFCKLKKNQKQKQKTRVAILISDKTDFKKKVVDCNKGQWWDFKIIKGSVPVKMAEQVISVLASFNKLIEITTKLQNSNIENLQKFSWIDNGLLFGDKKNWNLAMCNNMGGLRRYCAKRSKSEIDKCHTILLKCVI